MSILVLSVIVIAVVATALFVFRFLKTKRPIFFVNLVLVYAVLAISYFLVTGIQAPIEFKKEREYRYSYVIENLKDIRKAELAYKDKHGVFTGDFDVLIDFVKSDSMQVVRKLGTLPDTLTEAMASEIGMSITKIPSTVYKDKTKELFNVDISNDFEVADENTIKQAMKIGYLIRDTIEISVMDTVFGANYPIDSLRFVPFSTKKAEFKLAAGEIETASKIKVQVFEAIDTDPFDPNMVLKVGSLEEATNNSGNWE